MTDTGSSDEKRFGLELTDLTSGYGGLIVLRGLSLDVAYGEIVAVLGPNGAGKTSTVLSVMGALRIVSGRVSVHARDVTALPTERVARLGVALVPEGRRVFKDLSVEENLQVGGLSRPRHETKEGLATVYDLFPVLAGRRRVQAGLLSGGQQQMLAIGRALMARPTLLLLDEPSLGLAPKLVDEVMVAVQRIRDTGVAILLVEQNAHAALEISDRGYVLERGSVRARGTARELICSDLIREAYLGV